MKEYTDRSFINELGNQISIRLQDTSTKELQHRTIMINGPTSTWTCRLTLQEARVLRDILEEEL